MTSPVTGRLCRDQETFDRAERLLEVPMTALAVAHESDVERLVAELAEFNAKLDRLVARADQP